ncbi:hypothetical protein P8C59_000576 [Phyllachora maydis]|uniref:RRM domain-containing protein n=1 Tax=Phyllachora maydis TaxID=1825666 RepID=A0AAD9HWE1_9PEZI|nr:hypothetical protein P8C59_000576 [Phyllachora maydis]
MAAQSVCTVYVRNIQERIKPDVVQNSLRAIFEGFGPVIDIVSKHNVKAKGQAFIVFETPDSALKAAEAVQGFEIFGKPLQVALARTRSDATVLRTGNEEDFDHHKRRRMAERDKKKALESAEEQKRLKRPLQGAADPSGRPAKQARGAGLKPTGPGPAAVVPDEYLPPNRILFVQNLPDEYDVASLTAIFNRFEGFREVRMVPGRKGIAFVEYEAEQGAIAAKEQTAGMPLKNGEKIMKVTYQRQ